MKMEADRLHFFLLAAAAAAAAVAGGGGGRSAPPIIARNGLRLPKKIKEKAPICLNTY